MRFEFIQAEKDVYPVATLCRVLRVLAGGEQRLCTTDGVSALLLRFHRSKRPHLRCKRMLSALAAGR